MTSSRSVLPERSTRGRGFRTRPRNTRSTIRSPSPSSASTARPRRCSTPSTPDRRTHERRCSGGPTLERHEARAHRRHHRLRARRGARGGRRRRRPGGGAGDAAWTTLASITYRNPVPPTIDRVADASREQPPGRPGLPHLCGGSTPAAAATARSTRIELDGRARGRPPADGHDHQLHGRHAGAVPRARPRPSRSPGSSSCSTAPTSSSSYQPVIDLPAAEVHVGSARRRGVGLARRARSTTAARMGGAYGHLLGWIPTGEPDVDDPDLVNRIF